MKKINLEDIKKEYENIEVPEELDFIVKKSLRQGRRSRKIRSVSKIGSDIAVSFLGFIIAVNVSPKIAYAASSIPGLDKLVQLVTLDKGFTNAVDKGLTKVINYKEEKDGVKLVVNGVAGDYKRLWVDYELIGNDSYEIDVKVKDSITDDEVPVGIGFHDDKGMATIGNGYLEIAFQEFVESFTLEVQVGKKQRGDEVSNITDSLETESDEEGTFFERNNIEYITTFEVPITLEKEVLGNVLKEVKLDNNIISTEIGDIIIDKLETSKTRIAITFNLDSDIDEYMGMKNPILIDDKGNEYTLSTFYFSEDKSNNSCLEFTGEIDENVKSLRFKCDGVYYADKNDSTITINLKDKFVESNSYNIEFDSYEDKILTLKAIEVEGVSFNEVTNEKGESLVLSKGSSSRSYDDGKTYEVINYLKVLDETLEEIQLEISWIRKDKIKSFDVELIK